MPVHDLATALFQPRGVALVGASGDPGKHTARPLRYLKSHGYGGHIVAVNPNRDEVLGELAYASLEDAPGPIDHAFIMVPGTRVPDVVRQCGRAGVAVATVYSDGFAESGAQGRRRQQELVEIARKAGVRLLGPNSMGVLNTAEGLALTVNATLEEPHLSPGVLSVVSQSGSVMGALLSRGRARGLEFGKAVSVGNEADICVGEIVDVLVEDDDTSAIVLFLESLRRSEVLARAARRAFDAGKPIVAYKLGRSPAGQALAATHSGAITGSAQAAREFFRANGILEVGALETLFELPALVQGHAPPTGRRAAVLTTTGGGAAMVVDRLGEHDIDIVPAPPEVVATLEALGVKIPASNLVDLTMAGAREPVYGAALEGLLASPNIDLVVAVVGSSGQYHPEVAVSPIVEAHKAKPVAVFIVPQADASLARLAEVGMSAFRTPESCADAVQAYFCWRPPMDEPLCERDLAPLQALIAEVGRRPFNESEAARCFGLLGIPQAPTEVIETAEDLRTLSYPLAVKALHADIGHKTEHGAVMLDVTDQKMLVQACRDVGERLCRHQSWSPSHGYLIQEMQTGLVEALLGYRHDPEVGPMVVVASGGTLTEVYADSSVRLAPVGMQTAEEMIDEVKGFAPLRGYRSHPEGDVRALAEAIVAFSDLARLPGRPVAEAEINPLIIKPAGEGVVAVDALLVLGSSDTAE